SSAFINTTRCKNFSFRFAHLPNRDSEKQHSIHPSIHPSIIHPSLKTTHPLLETLSTRSRLVSSSSMEDLLDVSMEDRLSRGLDSSIHAKGNSPTPPKNWADDGVDPPSSDPISGVSEGRRPEPIGGDAVAPQQNLTVTS